MNGPSALRLSILVAASVVATLVHIQPLSGQTTSKTGEQKPPRTHTVYVGVLEDDREEVANWAPGPAGGRRVRLAFQKTGSSDWTTLTTLDRVVAWTVAFDGKSIGVVTSRPALDAAGSLINFGTHMISSPGKGPTVGQPSEKFADTGGLTKTRRPLVVISEAEFRDPDGWRRATPSTELTKLVRQAFRRDFPHVDRCDEEQPSNTPWRFPDSDIELTSVYGSNNHSFLVQAQLKHGNCWVDDRDDPWADQWFFVTADRTARRIGAFMTLLDAGDYDADGKSEVVFFLTQPEDTDGYVLFYSDFWKKAVLTWTYH